MTSCTFTEMQLSALRAVVEASRMNDPQVSVPWELLQSLGRLIGCDSMSMEGVDYGRGLTYFAQDTGNGEQHFRSAFDKEEETGFWSLVRQTPCTAPWIPETNESVVVKPTDLMSVRQLRALPLYIDGWGGGPGPTTYLMAMHLEDGFRRQLRLLCWRHSARRDFNERQRFIMQLLMPHIESAHRRGERLRTVPRLTPQQTSLMQFVREGCTNYQIARRMELSEGTVRTHLNNIYSRLGVASRTEAVTRVFTVDHHPGFGSQPESRSRSAKR